MTKRSRWLVVFVVAAIIIVGGVFYLLKSGATVQEIAELATQGGEFPLREPMRPSR